MLFRVKVLLLLRQRANADQTDQQQGGQLAVNQLVVNSNMADLIQRIHKKAPKRGVFINKNGSFQCNGNINSSLHKAVQLVLLVRLLHKIND